MKKQLLVILSCFSFIILLVIGVSGCGPEQAKTGDIVSVHYTVKTENGETVDSSLNGEPLEVTLGKNQVIPGFEQALLGMVVGDNKTFTVPVDEAYGPYRDDLVMEVPREQLADDLEPEVGMQLQSNQPDGTVMIFTVTDVSEESVTVDANHPLAGHDLTFSVELIEIIKSKEGSTQSNLSAMTLNEALSSGKTTLAEFGSNSCIPCKQMKPILEELSVEYKGKVNILLIEVYDNKELTRQYQIMGIPTQIVFDKYGYEITRHTGFWAKEDIVEQLRSMGVK